MQISLHHLWYASSAPHPSCEGALPDACQIFSPPSLEADLIYILQHAQSHSATICAPRWPGLAREPDGQCLLVLILTLPCVFQAPRRVPGGGAEPAGAVGRAARRGAALPGVMPPVGLRTFRTLECMLAGLQSQRVCNDLNPSYGDTCILRELHITWQCEFMVASGHVIACQAHACCAGSIFLCTEL